MKENKKKQYEKPEIYFEDYTEYESIFDPRHMENEETDSVSLVEFVKVKSCLK